MKAVHRLAVCMIVALAAFFLSPAMPAQETKNPAQTARGGF